MAAAVEPGVAARRIHIRGVVQGVGFRPFVYRLARAHALGGWVLNGEDGVRIHVEGPPELLDLFVRGLADDPPPAAQIAAIDVQPGVVLHVRGFEIRHSESSHAPTTRISPDLPVCDACLRELNDPGDRRHGYPYVNCTNCGPRFTIVRGLPYDRPLTTMAAWPLCRDCEAEYRNPADRRFHAQPVACPACGPRYALQDGDGANVGGNEAIAETARLLAAGRIVAVKGIGGYHLACDASNAAAVAALRERKYRKEKPFALMVRDRATAEATARLSAEAAGLLTSAARPIVLAPAAVSLPGVAPECDELGVMLPYAPIHSLLFAAGAPDRLVMTSGNRSSEPIAYEDDEARRRLGGLADAFLIGERPIARRVDDSVVRVGVLGPTILRRSRGYAPGAAAALPASTPILAVGADLKNAIALVVDGQAYVSQHIGDLSDFGARQAFEETIRDLLSMYEVSPESLTVVRDLHPEHVSAAHALTIPAERTIAVQHHRAHVASVAAERGAFERRLVGVAFDGTGYGDDGAIWGGEIFVGSVREGFDRVAGLRRATLPGGDAAARYPVQAAAGFLGQVPGLPDVTAPPFRFPGRYGRALALVATGVRSFPTTSAGRLFDTVAALLGFTREITFEGQAAMWLEHIARRAAASTLRLPCAFDRGEIDWRDTLAAVADARLRGRAPEEIARAFHRALADAIAAAVVSMAVDRGVDTVVLSGGVMQNDLLVGDIRRTLSREPLQLWANAVVPPNDGGISLGQAALACFA